MTAALAVRFVHVAAALTWVGGMLFVALVLVPIILVATGLINIWLRPELLTLGLVALAIALSAVHDFALVLVVVYLGLSFR